MRLVVDLTRCQGYAQCAFLAPDVFRMQGHEALWYDPEPGDWQREQVLHAAAACPVQAMRVDGAALSRTSRTAIPAPRSDEDSFRRPGRIVIVGASLAGLEAAATLRREGFTGSLTLIGDEAPLTGALGRVIGAIAGDMQRDHGVDLRCGVSVRSLEGDSGGQLHRAELSDGTELDVDVAIVALGSVPSVEWLEGSGLAVGPWGVACDAGTRAFTVDGMVTDDIFVAGDVARFPHPLYNYQFLALAHWGNAVAQAEVAAHNMISSEANRWPHLAIPSFWSSQFDTEIKSVGVPTFADEVVIAQGSTADRRFVAVYGYRGRVTGAVAFNQAKWLEFYQGLIERSAAFPPDFRGVDQPAERRPVPAGIPAKATYGDQATVVVTGHNPGERRAQLVRRTRRPAARLTEQRGGRHDTAQRV